MNAASATPAIREALLIALHAPLHTLTRNPAGFCSGTSPTVTRRTVNVLLNARLLEFDNPDMPRAATLTDRGIALARELHTAATHVRTQPTSRSHTRAPLPAALAQ